MENRYSWEVFLPEIGKRGQNKIRSARILVIGSGGTGSAVLYYLAAAGTGTIGIADHKNVVHSNLNRQILYDNNKIGLSKAESAAMVLRQYNPDICIHSYTDTFDRSTGIMIIENYDLVIDASDNWETRQVINALCIDGGKPYIYSGVGGWNGQYMLVAPGHSACLACVFPDATDNGHTKGILGVVTGIAGSYCAAIAIKYILGRYSDLLDKLYYFNAETMVSRIIRVKKIPDCRVCS